MRLAGDLGLYARLVGSEARSQWQYRTGLALDLFGSVIQGLLDLTVMVVWFTNVDALGDWSAWQVGFLYGVAQTAFALALAIFGPLDQMPELIRTGRFDSMLVRPRSPLLLAMGNGFALRRFGQLLQALVVLVVAWRRAEVAVTPATIAMVATTVVCGLGVYGAIWVVGASTTFWTIDTMEITNSFTYGGRQLTSYPVSIYGTWLRRLITFVVPLAAIAYFSTRYLVGLEPDGTGRWVRFAGFPAAVVAWAVALAVWTAAVRSYRGTGS